VCQQLHNWSWRLNFDAQAVVERSRLNDEIHNRQVDSLLETLERMTQINHNPFKALLDHAAEDSEGLITAKESELQAQEAKQG